MSQSYFPGQPHVPDQPPMFIFNGGDIEGSQQSFPSRWSSHPLTYYPNYASGPSSSSTSELGSARAISFLTPSTPTSSNNGDCQDFFADATPCEHQSPNDPDRTLQGINSSNHDTGIYHVERTFNPNSPYDSRYASGFNYSGAQLDYISGISAQIPARANPLQEPWSQVARYYNGPSNPSDVVEEGPIFEEFNGYNCWPSQWTQGNVPRYGQQERARSTSYEGYVNIPQHQPLPNTGQDHTYQENGNTEGDSPISTSSDSATTPRSSTAVAPRKTGGRKGPLSDSGRQNAKLMRKKVCCYRCFIMREKCYLDEQSKVDGICQRCRKVFHNPRSWGIPCSPIGLRGRTEFMVPGFLKNQLEGCEVTKFVKAHVASLVPHSSIVLRLTMGFGEPLILDAVEIIPKGQEAIRMHGVSAACCGSTRIVKLNSPPILPRLTDRKALERDFDRWLNLAVGEPDSDLPKECFPEAHEVWQREILTIICKYYQATIPKLETSGSGPYHTLRRALKLVVLNHMMYYPFVVPDEDIESLYQQLQGRYSFEPTEWVCPRLANKVIKSMLFPLLDAMALKVLSGLQDLLRTRGDEDSLWDPLFCIIFLCLIVVGKFQVSFLERAAIGLANRDPSFLNHHAVSGIEDMERELLVHLIGQFHARLGTTRKGNGNGKMFNPLAKDRTTKFSWLAEKVGSATRAYGHQIFDQKEPRFQDLGAMKENNVMRVLAQFMAPFDQLQTQGNGMSD